MKIRNFLLFGFALALILTVGFPSGAQAQQNDPAASYGTAGQGYDNGYYGYDGRGYNHCPMGPGYGYAAPANQDSQQYVSRPRKKVHHAARGSWNSGYARGSRGGWGCW